MKLFCDNYSLNRCQNLARQNKFIFQYANFLENLWYVAFQLKFMALAVDTADEYDPSNKLHHQLQPKKTKLMLH